MSMYSGGQFPLLQFGVGVVNIEGAPLPLAPPDVVVPDPGPGPCPPEELSQGIKDVT